MARRKNAPNLVKLKCGVAERLRELRTELYGDRGGPELARALNLPVRTWYNYESGVTVPAEVILRLIELTHVEAAWLLHGTSPKFREPSPTSEFGGKPSVEFLLRAALKQLEQAEVSHPTDDVAGGRRAENPDLVLIRVDDAEPEAITHASGPRYIAAMTEWQAACLEHRCLRVVDDSMAPLITSGAYVAYSDQEVEPRELDDRLVAAWLGGAAPIVRRFHYSGRLALLRAENSEAVPQAHAIDLLDGATPRRFRAVSWISTPR